MNTTIEVMQQPEPTKEGLLDVGASLHLFLATISIRWVIITAIALPPWTDSSLCEVFRAFVIDSATSSSIEGKIRNFLVMFEKTASPANAISGFREPLFSSLAGDIFCGYGDVGILQRKITLEVLFSVCYLSRPVLLSLRWNERRYFIWQYRAGTQCWFLDHSPFAIGISSKDLVYLPYSYQRGFNILTMALFEMPLTQINCINEA